MNKFGLTHLAIGKMILVLGMMGILGVGVYFVWQRTSLSPSASESEIVQVYFGNSVLSENSLMCDQVFGVARQIEVANDPLSESLDLLLQGVTDEETALGYFSGISVPTRLVSLELVGDEAVVTFGHELTAVSSGACRVTLIRAQIEQTLKQFSDVKQVKIRIDGVPDEEVLQP